MATKGQGSKPWREDGHQPGRSLSGAASSSSEGKGIPDCADAEVVPHDLVGGDDLVPTTSCPQPGV